MVATVAATTGDDLIDLAKKYSGGFDGDSHEGRFGLVIGLNGVGNDAAISQKIQDFTQNWDNRFPVAVVGFTWKNPTTDIIDQKSIPYGGIRETIVRNPVTESLVQQIRENGGDNEVYLHIGDADVNSLNTKNGPLFDAVNTTVSNNPEGPPEVISGGYGVRPGDGVNANNAARLDLDVRNAMAKVDSRSVYFPEPNTFVRLNGGRLENDATFGTKNPNTGNFDYGAKEGQGLVDSVLAQRKAGWDYDGHLTDMAKFDSDLAVETDGTRIAGKVGTNPANVTKLTQSHANETTWADQVGHYLENHTSLDPNLAKTAAKVAFDGINPPGPMPKAPTKFGDLGANLPPAERKAFMKGVQQNAEDGKKLLGLTLGTRQALIRNLGGHPGQTSSEAPPNRTTTDTQHQANTSTKNLPGPKEWGGRRDTAPPSRLVSERFDPKKAIANQFDGDREGLKGGQLEGAVTHIRYDVRRFETSPGNWVREFTVPLDLTSSTGSVSLDTRNQLAQNLQNHLDETVNQQYTLPNGDQFHVTVDAHANDNVDPNDDSWTADPKRGVPVNVHDSTVDKNPPSTNQTNWDVHDENTGLTHEVMHFLGLGEGYRNSDLLFNRQDQPGVMGPDAWTDSTLTKDNLAKIEEISNQANIRDHHLGAERGPTPNDSRSDIGQHTAVGQNRHTPAAAPKPKNTPAPGPGSGNNAGKVPPTTGGKDDFKQAQKNFQFKTVHESGIIGTVGNRNAGNQHSVGVVATVAATTGDDLNALAKKYSEGFDGNSHEGRFGLVIGINGVAGHDATITQKIQDFQQNWDNRFPVAVVGFTWKNPTTDVIDQKSIPYGGIRETIVRNPVTTDLITQIRGKGGDNEVYLHTGDADVDSLNTDNGPLFDAVNTTVKNNPEGPPEVISGGYRVRDNDTALAKSAAELDLDIRKALADVDSRSVYFPEPNTFVRVNGDKLENDATFGTENPNTGRFDYGAKEGQGLVDSVLKQRKAAWDYDGHVRDMAKFDSSLAIKTDGTRIAAKVGANPANVTKLTQSHANETTWADQVGHYLGNHTDLDPNLAKIAAKAAFHGLDPAGPLPAKPKNMSDVAANLSSDEQKALVKGMRTNPEQGKKLAAMTVGTRTALIDGLGRMNTRTSVQGTAQAPPRNLHTPAQAPARNTDTGSNTMPGTFTNSNTDQNVRGPEVHLPNVGEVGLVEAALRSSRFQGVDVDSAKPFLTKAEVKTATDAVVAEVEANPGGFEFTSLTDKGLGDWAAKQLTPSQLKDVAPELEPERGDNDDAGHVRNWRKALANQLASPSPQHWQSVRAALDTDASTVNTGDRQVLDHIVDEVTGKGALPTSAELVTKGLQTPSWQDSHVGKRLPDTVARALDVRLIVERGGPGRRSEYGPAGRPEVRVRTQNGQYGALGGPSRQDFVSGFEASLSDLNVDQVRDVVVDLNTSRQDQELASIADRALRLKQAVAHEGGPEAFAKELRDKYNDVRTRLQQARAEGTIVPKILQNKEQQQREHLRRQHIKSLETVQQDLGERITALAKDANALATMHLLDNHVAGPNADNLAKLTTDQLNRLDTHLQQRIAAADKAGFDTTHLKMLQQRVQNEPEVRRLAGLVAAKGVDQFEQMMTSLDESLSEMRQVQADVALPTGVWSFLGYFDSTGNAEFRADLDTKIHEGEQHLADVQRKIGLITHSDYRDRFHRAARIFTNMQSLEGKTTAGKAARAAAEQAHDGGPRPDPGPSRTGHDSDPTPDTDTSPDTETSPDIGTSPTPTPAPNLTPRQEHDAFVASLYGMDQSGLEALKIIHGDDPDRLSAVNKMLDLDRIALTGGFDQRRDDLSTMIHEAARNLQELTSISDYLPKSFKTGSMVHDQEIRESKQDFLTRRLRRLQDQVSQLEQDKAAALTVYGLHVGNDPQAHGWTSVTPHDLLSIESHLEQQIHNARLGGHPTEHLTNLLNTAKSMRVSDVGPAPHSPTDPTPAQRNRHTPAAAPTHNWDPGYGGYHSPYVTPQTSYGPPPSQYAPQQQPPGWVQPQQQPPAWLTQNHLPPPHSWGQQTPAPPAWHGQQNRFQHYKPHQSTESDDEYSPNAQPLPLPPVVDPNPIPYLGPGKNKLYHKAIAMPGAPGSQRLSPHLRVRPLDYDPFDVQTQANFEASGSLNKKGRHHATAQVFDDATRQAVTPQTMWRSGDDPTSLGMSQSERRNISHTEAKIIRDPDVRATFGRGRTLVISGESEPCTSCRTLMTNFAAQNGGRIDYVYRDKVTGENRRWSSADYISTPAQFKDYYGYRPGQYPGGHASAPDRDSTTTSQTTRPADLPGPQTWGERRDTARPSRFVSERFDPKKAIADQFDGNREGLRGGQLEGAVTHIRYDVRRFETSPGKWVREFTVPVDLTSASGSVSVDARHNLAQDLQEHLDRTVNQRYTLPNGDQLHVRIDAHANESVDPDDDRWTAEPSRSVPVDVHDSTVDDGPKDSHGWLPTNQLNWDVRDPRGGLTHEVMHFLGLGEGYKDGALLFNRENQPGVMGKNAWSDSSLTPDNLAKIHDVSTGALIHDHGLAAQGHDSDGPARDTAGPSTRTPESGKGPGLHTPSSAPAHGWGTDPYGNPYGPPPAWAQQGPPPPAWAQQGPPPPAWHSQSDPFYYYKPDHSSLNSAKYSPNPQPPLPLPPSPDLNPIRYQGPSSSDLYNQARIMNPAPSSARLSPHTRIRPLDDDPFDVQLPVNFEGGGGGNKAGRHHATAQVVDSYSGQALTPATTWRSGEDPTSHHLPDHMRRKISHTEAKIIRDPSVRALMGNGRTLRISGESEPCVSCQSLMMAFAAETGGRIEYLYRDKYTNENRKWSSDSHITAPKQFESYYGYRPSNARPRGSRHTPASAPSRPTGATTGPANHATLVPRSALSPAQNTQLNSHGLESVLVGGAHGPENFRLAVAESISQDAPDEHARITTALENASALTDPDAIATAGGVRVHVLGSDGTWTSHGPETGRPVHVVKTEVDGRETYVGTRKTVETFGEKPGLEGTAEQERVVTVADDDPAPDTRSLTDRLPEYAKKGQALGSLVPVNPQGVKQVGDTIKRLVTSLDSRRNPPDPVGIDAITGTLDSAAFESFLGPGRKSMVRVGEKWYEVHVRAELDLDAVPADAIAKQPHATISDVNDQTQATHAQGQNDTIARTVGTSYFALIPPGAYVSVAPTVQLATAAQTHTSTVTGTEQRVVRSAGDVDGADVNVKYSITVTDQVGGLTGSTVDGKVSLLWSQDLGNLKPDAEAKGDPKPDWAENIELLAPEAVLLDEQALFDKVAKRLHPSVTKFGAPGRQALREFVSGGGIRGVLGTALQGGPVVSSDLLSPHGSHRDAVQLQARPKDVDLVGVVPGDSELRFNDSSVNGGATAAASKSGMDLAVTVGGGSYLPGTVSGLVGVSGTVSSKVTETATGGTGVTAKNTVEAKGDIGIYKVKVDVDVVTSAGEVETVEATAYVRMGLPEAKAQGLPVPGDTRDKLTDVGKRYEPPYLAAAAAAGHVRTGSFSPAAKVQPQIESALRDRPGMEKFLPRWDKFQADDKSSSRDIAERFANLRKLTATFSPAALKAKMDTLLGPGVSVQLKRRGLFTDEYISVTVKAKLSPGRHLGQATGRSVKGSVATAPSLSSATTVDKSWSVGLEGRMVIPQPTSIATSSLSPAVVPIQYSDAYTWKNSGGPTVTTTTSLSGSPDAQVFEHDVEFDVEITSYTRNRPWVKRLTPGSPFRATPKVSTVAKTGDPALPKISGKVDLWVNDGSALKKDPGDFLPGKPGTTVLNKNDTPTIDDLLAGPKPDQPKFLHVEAFTNTEALRDEALRQLERASDGDGVLGLSGGEARKRVDRMFSPETFRGGLPKFLRQGARAGGFRYERRVADRVGGLGMNVALSNPKVVVASDAGGSETTFAGGAKAAFEQTHKQALEGNVQLGVTIRPDGSMATAHGQGQVYASAKWSPWTRTSGSSTEVSASVDHLNRANAKGRTVLVQYDADVRLVAETRQESLVNGSTSRAGADVKLPGAVYVRMSEDQAREQGLLPEVEPRTAPPGKMAPPALVGRESSALGAAVIEDAPDLSQLVRDARTALGRTGDKLLPKSVLDDSMTNLQRTLDLASPDAVTSLVDSALDGGAPLLLHDAGVLSTDTYQVLLKATITDTEFLDVVHDGGEIDHVVSAAETDKENAGHGSSYGGQFRGAGRGLFSDTKPDVSGYEGLTLGVSGSKTKTDQTVSATATTKGSKASQSGPAVRYRHQLKFELVVQRGGKTYPVTEQNANVTVRSAADDHQISTEGQAPKAYAPRTTELTAADTTPEKLAEWQAQGVGKLPPSAHTEGVRGSAAVQAGAVRALRLAGAGSGLTGPGTGANNTLVTSLTNEVLQGHLPAMLDGPLASPDLHEASLIKNGHGSVKVYSRLVNPDLTALSDTVKLERTDQTTATFTGEAKEALSGENQYMPGVGGITDPKDNSHSWSGADIRNPAAMSDPTATVAGGQRSTVAKPKGRSGLVGFDVEYRVVADLGRGRTAAVEVKVPASALVRMSDVDLEKLLGEALPDAITKAQDAVKDAAASWRKAEEAVETAQHEADDRWLDGRDRVKTLAEDANGLAVETDADPARELRQALTDAENDAKDAGRELREGNAEITRLQDVSEQALALAAVTDEGSPERQQLLDQVARAEQGVRDIRTAQPALVQRRQDAQDRAEQLADVLDAYRNDNSDFTSRREDALRDVREAREKADEARKKWWQAKEEVDWRLATHVWPAKKVESRFDPRSAEHVVEAPDTAPDTEPATISGWDVNADRPYDFDVDEVQLHQVTDRSGKVVAVSFLPAAEQTSAVEHDWVADNSGEVSSLDEGVTSKTLDPVVAEARRNGTTPDLGGRSFGDWAAKSAAPWGSDTGDTFFVFAHGKPQSVKLTLLGGQTVRVDGKTFARIVASSAPFAQAGPKSSVTLIACSTGQTDGPGGVAHDFQRALSDLGGPTTVHAPTKPTLFGRDTTTLGKALGSTGAFTAVTDGGHFRTFGGRPGDETIVDLVRELDTSPRTEPPAGPISPADHDGTLALASTVERQLADTAARTGELRLTDVHDLVARHERPDVVYSAVLTHLASGDTPVHAVVDVRRDPDTGEWTRVPLPPMARGLITVTGKGTWSADELARPARLIPAWTEGPARETTHTRPDATHYAETLAEHHLDGEPLPPVTVPADRVDQFNADVTRLLGERGFGDLAFGHLVRADHTRLTGEVVGEPGVTVDFAPGAVTTTVLSDHTGTARGLTFLDPAEATKVQTWLQQTRGENLVVEADPDEMRAFATGATNDLRGRGPGDGGIPVRTPWADELAEGRTFLVTGHGEETRVKVAVTGPDGTRREVYVDGETLARIVTASPEFADAQPESVTLFQCAAARRLGPGGVAHDFQAALETRGGPSIVHAATDSVLANHRDDSPDDEPSAPLFGARDDAFTAVVRGGHWETLGRPLDADAVVDELTNALLKNWRYARVPATAGPIRLADRARTLYLTAEVVNAVYDRAPDDEVQALLGRHEDPELLAAVANEYLRATAAPDELPPYDSAAELTQDLRATSADHGPAPAGAPLLGPDLFGFYRAPEPPDFLRGHDYSNLTAGQGLALLDTLDLTRGVPVLRDLADPANLPDLRDWTVEHTRADDRLSAWAPGDVEPLEKTTSTPLLMHAIWLGGPLRDAGTMSAFRDNFGGAASRLHDGVVPVLWTDVPRSQIELALTTEPPAEGPDPLADVRDFVNWAQQHHVRLVNVDEVFSSENPMLLNEFYQSETGKLTGPGYAAASDILRMELMNRFGGLYTDGDNVVESLEDLFHAATSREGYATHRIGMNVANSAFAMSKGHPFARVHLDVVRENYGKTQRNLMPPEAYDLPPVFFQMPQGRVHRNSIIVRTGPSALSGTARRIGLPSAFDLPEMTDIRMNSDGSWLKPPAAGTRPVSGRDETLELTQHVVQSLVRGLYNRAGDLHLTAVEPAVRRHADPDLVWDAALSFLAADPELAPLVRTVTDGHTYTATDHDVQLPASARALLDIDPGRVHRALGEVQHGATLRNPDDAVLVSDVDSPLETGARELAQALRAVEGELPAIHVTGGDRARAREAARELAGHLGRELGDRDLLARVPVKIRVADGSGVTVSFRPTQGAAVEFSLDAPAVFSGVDGKPYASESAPFAGYRGAKPGVVMKIDAAPGGSAELTQAADRPPTLVLASGALAAEFTQHVRSSGMDLPVHATPKPSPDNVVDTFPAVSYLVSGDHALTEDDRRTIAELGQAAEHGWWYRPSIPVGPVRLDDRTGTLALLSGAVSALRSGGTALDLTAAADIVARHEQPDLLWTAALELASHNADVQHVIDHRLVDGRWQQVRLPQSARERFTVTGKGVWRDGAVSRPVRLNTGPGPASDFGVEPVPLPLDDSVAQWIAESTVERTADGLPAPHVQVSGPDDVRAEFVAQVQAKLTELTPAGVTPHAAASIVTPGPGTDALATISLPATAAPATLSAAETAVAVGLAEEYTLLQLHGVADTLLAKTGREALLDLANEVAHGTDVGRAADAVEVLDRHGALDAALDNGLFLGQFRKILGHADAESYARDLATAIRAFASEKFAPDVLKEAVRGALEGWRGGPGTFEQRVERTRDTLWVMRRLHLSSLAWLNRWRTAEHIRQYAARMKEQAAKQDAMLAKVSESEDAFLASVGEPHASGGGAGDGE
ncbi:TcdA/TcdB catalytic glycosyltransferase domain-containing protein [Amycolatopsis sp. NPDC001319]|uniref:TcdA/TcdB catalytic glycosyltransferase domain-containing protein n=1 Tax=unclassified Amycolatopsis TaxID=2618356 RepID=UPI0036C2CEA5